MNVTAPLDTSQHRCYIGLMNTTTHELHEAEKARRRQRFEHRTGAVHLRGGRKPNTRHTAGRRPYPTRGSKAAQAWRNEVSW